MRHFRGDELFYPASVVKLYFLAYLAFCLDEDRVQLSPELDRAARDMIVDSSNDATALVVDAITQTTGGPELEPPELARWMEQRQQVNKWLRTQGFSANASQKTWNEGSYGRERQGAGPNLEHRNSCTANDTLKLQVAIHRDQILSPERCAWMRGLLSRSIPADDPLAGLQAREFIGAALPAGSKLWSKAGYMSEVRNDVAVFELPNGETFGLAIFTRGLSDRLDLIPQLAEVLVESLW